MNWIPFSSGKLPTTSPQRVLILNQYGRWRTAEFKTHSLGGWWMVNDFKLSTKSMSVRFTHWLEITLPEENSGPVLGTESGI